MLKKWEYVTANVILGGVGLFVLFIVVSAFVSGCTSEPAEPESWDSEVVIEDTGLPPAEEIEIMNRRINYCGRKFGSLRYDSRVACIAGYMAQPIQPVQAGE